MQYDKSLDYYISRAIIEAYHKLHSKPKINVELKERQVIWDSLPQGPIDKAIKEFLKASKAHIVARLDTLNIHDDCKLLTPCLYHSC